MLIHQLFRFDVLVYCVLIMYDFGVDLGRRDVGVSDA
jgi:hypothetical protein